jgi:hypothetical protein
MGSRNWKRITTYSNNKDGYVADNHELILYERDDDHYWRLTDERDLKRKGKTDLIASNDVTGAQEWAERLLDGLPEFPDEGAESINSGDMADVATEKKSLHTRIELTDEQALALDPLFEKVREASREGRSCAIVAQVFPDGLVANYITGGKIDALAVALSDKEKYTPRPITSSLQMMENK